MKVTKEMIEAFIGSDQEAIDYLVEIANGEYFDNGEDDEKEVDVKWFKWN